ncbi:glycerophosphodiesterase GDE1 [Microthyrium microscopicum]|uniref:Glycerophosphodiesterase GDE1 n=1 Tax=Microthyrium microscopicum TaxID=703497 RepID=A0A6A6U7J1_9PEZI|nr:glycerophosphodiesterase GDE1 [Microthyrium microscopicum]
MKFGHNLPRNQVPEWASSYIDYKGLKKLIKSAAREAQQGGTADLAGLFFSLDRNLENVDEFYNRKYAESNRRLQLLSDRYGGPTSDLQGMDRDELEELAGTLLELRGQLRKLKWHGEVNRRGFVKITKKLDKKIPGPPAQQSYLTSKVEPRAFASNKALVDDVQQINDWLSAIGDIDDVDDVRSVKSAGSTRIVSSRAILDLPPGLLDTVDQCIRADDASLLDELLLEANVGAAEKVDAPSGSYKKLLLSLLQRAISCRSRRCVEKLLNQLDPSIDDLEDIDQRNCLHRLVISIGRIKTIQTPTEPTPNSSDSRQFLKPAQQPIRGQIKRIHSSPERVSPLASRDDSIQFFSYLLQTLKPHQREALRAKDSYGKTPLHYAGEYGISRLCSMIALFLERWNVLDISDGIDSPAWEDLEGLTPLHLSVINNHLIATKALLALEKQEADLDMPAHIRKPTSENINSVLMLAAKKNSAAILKVLIEAGFDINSQNANGETPLHLAARFGHLESVDVILDQSLGQIPNLEIAEYSYSWTPLFAASVNGHYAVVQALIAAGAMVNQHDSSGWSVTEHAALRGHLEIAKCLNSETQSISSEASDYTASSLSTTPNFGSLEERKLAFASENHSMKTVKPAKTFGHRYLTDETMVLISLGSMDPRKQIEPIQLDAIPLDTAHATQLDTALSVIVSASHGTGEPMVIDLPAQDNINTEPFYFTTKDLSRVKLLFDIVHTYAGNSSQIVGRGVALLSSIRQAVGSKKLTLQGDVAVPIIATNTMEPIGCVNFNFLVITPFSHPNMSISEDHTYWRKTEPIVIGHRGMGKNFGTGRRSLELGENTIQSFIQAANLGASYVEFDVQVTKDGVPVLYHDFLVSETGIDAPVHTLTLQQFLHLGDNHTPLHSRSGSPRRTANGDNAQQANRRARAMSVGGSDDRNETSALDRMKYTRDVQAKGWKANMYGNVIKQPFTTLSEMFHQLPTSIGFNIEMKYPMLLESEEQGMDHYGVELNTFVDNVLDLVYRLQGDRHVIFSSFHPDVCLLLSFKQPSIPVLFLTDAGESRVSDVRAQSLQEAIRFASRWNLLGIVSASEPLVMCPRLVRVVKESGLVCVSFGTQNNEPENVHKQVREGLDAVIVDRVAAFRKGLIGDVAKKLPENELLAVEKGLEVLGVHP